MRSDRSRLSARVVVAAALTALVYVAVVLVTGFVACGVSGCGGGGFGPTYDPPGTQVGLLLAGVTLAPFVGFLLRGRGRVVVALGAVAAALVGSVLAMVLLGLGPDGCPQELSRTRAGHDAFTPGSPTCTVDGGR